MDDRDSARFAGLWLESLLGSNGLPMKRLDQALSAENGFLDVDDLEVVSARGVGGGTGRGTVCNQQCVQPTSSVKQVPRWMARRVELESDRRGGTHTCAHLNFPACSFARGSPVRADAGVAMPG